MNNKKENKDKIVLWEGFRKELPWILFWILLGIMVFGYYQDKKICDDVLSDPCDVCYKLNQTLISSDSLLSSYTQNSNIYINESILEKDNEPPNSRTTSNYLS